MKIVSQLSTGGSKSVSWPMEDAKENKITLNNTNEITDSLYHGWNSDTLSQLILNRYSIPIIVSYPEHQDGEGA